MEEYKKSNISWRMVKNIKHNVEVEIRITHARSAILSILLYDRHMIPIPDRQINRLRRFYSNCIRLING